MSLSILNNIPSLAAQNQLAITGSNLQRTLFRLSSGSRINSGADDAAGLAIADGLHANITALTQSARNANDGVGKLQVADGSLAQVTTLLNRAVTLATESATGTVTDPQRIALDAEFQAITTEINRIGSTTTYNGTAVFSNTDTSVYLSDSGLSSSITMHTGALSSTGIGLGAQANATLSAIGNVGAGDAVTIGGETYTFVASLTSPAVPYEVLVGADTAASLSNLAAAVNGGAGEGTVYGTGTGANGSATASIATGSTSTITFASKVAGAAGNSIVSTTTSAALGFNNAGTFSGGADGGSLLTATDAGNTLTSVNAAIQTVAGIRGGLGATINRLQSASNVISNQSQNLSAAEDGIRAADIAQEVANMTKYSILNQTGISSLAQANQMQQSVLALLK